MKSELNSMNTKKPRPGFKPPPLMSRIAFPPMGGPRPMMRHPPPRMHPPPPRHGIPQTMMSMRGPRAGRMPPPPPPGGPRGMMCGPPPPRGPPLRGPPPLMRPPFDGPPGPRPLPPPGAMRFMHPGGVPPRMMKKPFMKNQKGGAPGKRMKDIHDLELSKPWVNEAIKNEIMKKHKLHHRAKQTKKQSDIDEFKEQRNRVTTMVREARLEYIGAHPEEDVDKIMAEVNAKSNGSS